MNVTQALVALLSMGVVATSHAQSPPAAAKPPRIEDNSFLIEEAYNQEKGVVQHISVFQRDLTTRAWSYSFTQEWPVRGQRHQFSYTAAVARLGTSATGFGDVLLNYRLQLVADANRGLFLAPRLSLSVPTGDASRGLGAGATGLQMDIPVSQRMGEHFVTHVNAGYTWFGTTRDASGASGSLGAINLAHSVVWLAHPRLNVLLETVWSGSERRARGSSSWDATLLLNPGIRWAYNLKSGTQIVPGVSFPIGVGPSGGQRQLLLYFSVEHAFGSG